MATIYIIKDVTTLQEEEFNKYLLKISDSRREKTVRYRRYEDKCCSLVAGLLIKYMINTSIHIPYDDILIKNEPDGKLYCANENAEIHFNISHSGSCVAGIVDTNVNGIDIQKITKYDSNLVKRFFCRQEYDYLEMINAKENILLNTESKKIDYEFTKLWTIKESYMKYLGLGMKKNIDSFLIKYNDDTYSSIFDKEYDKDVDECIVYSRKIDDYYLSSISREKPTITEMSVNDLLLKM